MSHACRGSACALEGRHSYEDPSLSGEAVSEDGCLPQNYRLFRHNHYRPNGCSVGSGEG